MQSSQFQRIARRDNKVFFSDQSKEIEENNKWERLEISSRKLDTKGTFHAKIDTIKDRNGMDLSEAEDIKILRRGGKNTQKNYTKKIFTSQIIIMV